MYADCIAVRCEFIVVNVFIVWQHSETRHLPNEVTKAMTKYKLDGDGAYGLDVRSFWR